MLETCENVNEILSKPKMASWNVLLCPQTTKNTDNRLCVKEAPNSLQTCCKQHWLLSVTCRYNHSSLVPPLLLFVFSHPLSYRLGTLDLHEKRVTGIQCVTCLHGRWVLLSPEKAELSCGVLPELLWAYHLLDYTFLTQTVKMIDARRCHSLCSLSVRISTDWQG